jgi:hypothetical protein
LSDPDIKELMRIFRITVVLLALTGSAFAGDALSDTPENRAKLADEYLKEVPVKDLMDDITERLSATVPENKREEFKSMLTKHFDLDALVAAEKESLAKVFTVGELNAMIQYQSTPEGKSSMKKMGIYMADLMPVIQTELKKAIQAAAQEAKSGSQTPAAIPSPTAGNH